MAKWFKGDMEDITNTQIKLLEFKTTMFEVKKKNTLDEINSIKYGGEKRM